MSDTPSLFDPPDEEPEAIVPSYQEARRQRDVGMARSDAGAEDWQGYAYRFLVDYLRKHETVFTEDLWDAGLQLPPAPKGQRSFGSVMLRAARNGLVVKTQERRARRLGHLADGPVWRSLIYGRQT